MNLSLLDEYESFRVIRQSYHLLKNMSNLNIKRNVDVKVYALSFLNEILKYDNFFMRYNTLDEKAEFLKEHNIRVFPTVRAILEENKNYEFSPEIYEKYIDFQDYSVQLQLMRNEYFPIQILEKITTIKYPEDGYLISHALEILQARKSLQPTS